VKLSRVYFVCRACRVGGHGVDARLGVTGARTRQAERMLCLAGASWSFAQARRYLDELSGLKVSAGTVRSVCQREAPRIEAWQGRPAASQKYRQAAGMNEFQTDGTCINTAEGWKEMRVGVFAKRQPGEPADASQWNTRKLPSPQVRVAFAAIEDHDLFAARWPVVAGRLGIGVRDPLDVWADGAKWIWERASFHFAQAQGTLDVYHALEHTSAAAKGMFGEGTGEARQWQDRARDALLVEGHAGIERLIAQTRVNAVRGGQRAALNSLADYLRPHHNRLNYPERLAAGRPIGSGMIEGACKNYLGRRLKQTGARWLIPNANRMAALGSLVYADQGTDYWTGSN
jgi:hypothetical protein